MITMGKIPAGRGGDGNGLLVPAPNARMEAASGTIPARRRTDGARKRHEPPRESLTNLGDEGILTSDAPGPSRHSLPAAAGRIFDLGVRHMGNVDQDGRGQDAIRDIPDNASA